MYIFENNISEAELETGSWGIYLYGTWNRHFVLWDNKYKRVFNMLGQIQELQYIYKNWQYFANIWKGWDKNITS